MRNAGPSLLSLLAGMVFLTERPLSAAQDSAAGHEFFEKRIRPILARRCYSCHSARAKKLKASLHLDSREGIRKGGTSGAAVVPGKLEQSLLIRAVRYKDEELRMPPNAKLPAAEIVALEEWIKMGAPDPRKDSPAAKRPDARRHWSFRPPERPPVPRVADAAWARNPIDAFIAEQHARHKLTPRPEAPRHVLLRRVYLDLIGLPPTRDQLRAFLADTSPDAYEKVVDRLLASKHYGERWGRHWLDVWRYSDWYGFQNQVRHSQKHVWRWRDWTVDSLNADKGYDRMIVEMLAADELTPFDSDALPATGFLVRNRDTDSRESWMSEAVDHTSKAMVGLTVGCARCHDHMTDPISQTDYYRFRAFFEPYKVKIDTLPGIGGVARVYDHQPKAVTHFYIRGNDRNPDKSRKISPGVPEALGGNWKVPQTVALPPLARMPALRPAVHQATVSDFHRRIAEARIRLARAQSTLKSPPAKPEGEAAPAGDGEFLVDDFQTARPSLWRKGPGQWRVADGKLIQARSGDADPCWTRTTADHPPNFTAQVRFRITGGEKHRSVGIRFDASGINGQGVTLTANAAGSALAFFVDLGGERVAWDKLTIPMPVELNREMTLRLDVRDRLVNVFVDGRLRQATLLTTARRAGRFELLTYDASAEFHSVRIERLAEDAALAEKISWEKPLDLSTKEGRKEQRSRLERAVSLARLKMAALGAQLKSFQATAVAERLKYFGPPPGDEAEREKLFTAATAAQREAALLAAEENLPLAELEFAEARARLKPDDDKSKKAVEAAEKKAVTARKNLEAARKAHTQPPSPKYKSHPSSSGSSSGRRLALARWITARDNPLTARVAVNHVWMRHFDRPLVSTVFDFGMAGARPTHPALLDWLAVEFVKPSQRLVGRGDEPGWKTDPPPRPWSMKHLHRLIVTSRAYRSDSNSDAANTAVDPDNRFVWRMPSRRMEAELVRDSVFHVAGRLDATIGGPDLPCNDGMTSRRRSLYFRTSPEQQMTFLKLFDLASPSESYRRTESILPQQALALANSELTLVQSRLLARRLTGRAAGAADFVRAAFEQVLARPATGEDLKISLGFLKKQQSFYEKNTARLVDVATDPSDASMPSAAPELRARELLVHALLNHHDFVTIR